MLKFQRHGASFAGDQNQRDKMQGGGRNENRAGQEENFHISGVLGRKTGPIGVFRNREGMNGLKTLSQDAHVTFSQGVRFYP
jgi:hypothetical protein